MAIHEYLTIAVAGQEFGVLVMEIHDVLRAQATTRVPMASPEIAGTLNLRGRIVTAVDLRIRLGLPARQADAVSMHVVVQVNGESYGLVVDSVGEVVRLDDADREAAPKNLDPHWASLTTGVHRLEKRLLLVLDVAKVIDGSRRHDRAA